MRTRAADPLLILVQSYIDDHLRRVRGASRHTLRAYAHGLRLFFAFLADHLGRSIPRLQVVDIQVDAVLAFLDHIESKRRNTSATRNCRLAAIRGFVAHLLRHDIVRAAEYQRILAIPSRERGVPRRFRKIVSASSGCPSRRWTNAAAVSGQSGQIRSLFPFPWSRT